MQLNLKNIYKHWKVLLLIGIGMSLLFDLLYWLTGFNGIPMGNNFLLSRRGLDGTLTGLLYCLYLYLKKEPEL